MEAEQEVGFLGKQKSLVPLPFATVLEAWFSVVSGSIRL